MRTGSGFESYGRFDLGEDRDFAASLFSKLEGRAPEGDTHMLQMELVETYRGLPVNLEVLSCSVDEMSRNVKTVTLELFKRFNLADENLL